MAETAGLLEKGFQVLELLAETEQPMGPTEIGARLNMSKATVYRVLRTLVSLGYATHYDDGRYACGAKLIAIASTFINNLELQTVAKPYLIALYARLDLSVHLGMMENGKIIYTEKLEGHATDYGYTRVGYTSPAHCSSIGKCILAAKSSEELDELFHEYVFQRYTKNTITNPSLLKLHLRQVRSQGWAMDNEEYMADHCCVGAPIYDYRGDAIACVSVSGHANNFTGDARETIIREVCQTARLISQQVGYDLD